MKMTSPLLPGLLFLSVNISSFLWTWSRIFLFLWLSPSWTGVSYHLCLSHLSNSLSFFFGSEAESVASEIKSEIASGSEGNSTLVRTRFSVPCYMENPPIPPSLRLIYSRLSTPAFLSFLFFVVFLFDPARYASLPTVDIRSYCQLCIHLYCAGLCRGSPVRPTQTLNTRARGAKL